jgi:hypothetical protein
MLQKATPEQVRAAAAWLARKYPGEPVTRERLAEAIAIGAGAAPAPSESGGLGERKAPPGSIEEKLLREHEEKRRQSVPPPGMLRRQRRGL